MTKTATIRVPALEVTVPLAAAALPRDLVPMEGPSGEPALELVPAGGSLTVRARIDGKNYRKPLEQIAEHGPENVAVALLDRLFDAMQDLDEGVGLPEAARRAGWRPSKLDKAGASLKAVKDSLERDLARVKAARMGRAG